jgi:hypothetical protein
MFQTLKRRFVACIALVCALAAISCKPESWSNIQPAYKPRQNTPTVRVEGGSKLADRVSFYSFMDMDPVQDNSADMESFYGEARVAYALNDVWALAVEYDTGNNCDDLARAGVVITPKTWKGNFTMFKIYPWETSRGKGPQVCLYSSQQLTDKISAIITAEYNTDSRTLYLEPELRYTPDKRYFIFLQGRHFGSIDDRIDLAPVAGVGCNF